MTPQYQITANGLDLTSVIKSRLLRLNITDEVGVTSDQLQLDLDDRSATIVLPPFGATLECSLGYKESGLSAMGKWIVDEMEVEGPERRLTLRARSANTPASAVNTNSTSLSGLQAGTNDTYVGLTVGGIVAKIAARNHLGCSVATGIAGMILPHKVQNGEGDNSFLSNLIIQLPGYGLKIQNNKIVVFLHNSGNAPSGGTANAIAATAIVPSDCLRWGATLTRRSSHKRCRARWHNPDTGLDEYEESAADDATEEDTVHTLPEEHPTKPEAKAASDALVQRLDRNSELLRLTVQGNPVICSQSPLILSGFRPEIDHAWIAVRVTHSLDQSGYTTEIEAQKTLTQAAGYKTPKGLTAKRPGK